jgi:hypothetical protein
MRDSYPTRKRDRITGQSALPLALIPALGLLAMNGGG